MCRGAQASEMGRVRLLRAVFPCGSARAGQKSPARATFRSDEQNSVAARDSGKIARARPMDSTILGARMRQHWARARACCCAKILGDAQTAQNAAKMGRARPMIGKHSWTIAEKTVAFWSFRMPPKRNCACHSARTAHVASFGIDSKKSHAAAPERATVKHNRPHPSNKEQV